MKKDEQDKIAMKKAIEQIIKCIENCRNSKRLSSFHTHLPRYRKFALKYAKKKIYKFSAHNYSS